MASLRQQKEAGGSAAPTVGRTAAFLHGRGVDRGSLSFLLPLRNTLGVLCYQSGRGEGAHGQLNKGDANSCASANTAVGLCAGEMFGGPVLAENPSLAPGPPAPAPAPAFLKSFPNAGAT